MDAACLSIAILPYLYWAVLHVLAVHTIAICYLRNHIYEFSTAHLLIASYTAEMTVRYIDDFASTEPYTHPSITYNPYLPLLRSPSCRKL